MAALGTDLLSRKHILSHEIFDLLENSPTFSCLEKQSVLCWTCEGPGMKHISNVKILTENIRSNSWVSNSNCSCLTYNQQVGSISFFDLQ